MNELKILSDTEDKKDLVHSKKRSISLSYVEIETARLNDVSLQEENRVNMNINYHISMPKDMTMKNKNQIAVRRIF